MPFLTIVGSVASARTLWLAFGLLVSVGTLSFWNTSTLIKTQNAQMQLRALQNELQSLLSTVTEAESGQRGYLLVEEEAYLAPYRAAMKVADQQIDRVKTAMAALPDREATFAAMQHLVEMKFEELRTTIHLRQSDRMESAMQVVRSGRGQRLTDEIRGLADQIEQEIHDRLANNDAETAALSMRATLGGVLGSVSAAILFGLAIQRDLRERARVGQQAGESVRSAEASAIHTLEQADEQFEALGQQAGELARSMETLRIQTAAESDGQIEHVGPTPRDLAGEIETLGQEARELADSVETSRIQALNQSDKKIEALEQNAWELARNVEASRILTLDRSDKEIEALGQQARELATFVETLRKQTLQQSDGKIEALGQQARELARFVETSRVQALGQSNKEIRKLNEELEQRVLDRTAQLEVANKELDAFSYSISHDLRAPLRAIDGFSRIVLEDYGAPLASEGKAYLQLVRDNTRQMRQLVEDLLAFAHLGRQSLAKQTVEPDKIVRRCLEGMAKEQEGRQVDITIGDLPACHADPALLKQVWTNLLANALKYTRKREVARIEIGSRIEPRAVAGGPSASAENAGTELVYFVQDNGAGFDMKYTDKLFGVFQRLHSAADYEGTGVGLAIVQRIVQRHGGRIWADAIPSQGATFSFTLE